MIIRLALAKHQARSWHLALVKALHAHGHRVSVSWRETDAKSFPAGIATLLMLEDTLFGQRTNPMTAQVTQDPFKAILSHEETPDLCIDLASPCSTAHVSSTCETWNLEYNGHMHESALWASLLDGQAPHLQLMDSSRKQISAAWPAIENPRRIGAAADHVFARIISLIVASITGGTSALRAAPSAQNISIQKRRSLSFLGYSLAAKVESRLKKLAGGDARWRTAWRHLAKADQRVIETLQWPQPAYHLISDDRQRYYADPFPVHHQGRQFIFLEEFPYATGKGILSVAEIRVDGSVATPHPCLETGTHLSYPQVFLHNDSFYMIPESCAANRIDLYRAKNFPFDWQFEATLVADIPASDCTLFRHHDRWWILGTVAEHGGSTWDCLYAWHAQDLTGPWRAHPKNPLLIDASCARPAGAVVHQHKKILRPVQNCVGGYGTGLGIAEITRLDESDFDQVILAQLAPDPRWKASGVHTVNDDGRIEAVDYWA